MPLGIFDLFFYYYFYLVYGDSLDGDMWRGMIVLILGLAFSFEMREFLGGEDIIFGGEAVAIWGFFFFFLAMSQFFCREVFLGIGERNKNPLE